MLEQHPVPQNVTTFQFRLIGDMTIKQFAYLAGGALLAYISYKLPLPFFFRYPLVGIFAFGGIGFAFIPIEERPMDVWFLSFIKSIYSPTQYIWQREEAAPEPKTMPATVQQTKTLTNASPLDIFTGRLTAKRQVTAGTTPAHSAPQPVSSTLGSLIPSFPKRTPATTGLHTQQINQPAFAGAVLASTPIPDATKQAPQQPAQQPVVPPANIQHPTPPPVQSAPPTPQQTQQPTPVMPPQQQEQRMTQEPETSVPQEARFEKLEQQLAQAVEDKKKLERELQNMKNMMMGQRSQSVPAPVQQPHPAPAQPVQSTPSPTVAAQPTSANVSVITPDAARSVGIPTITTVPNVISGVVRERTGNLLMGILVTVKDKDDIPVRALKTNKLGQFAASTPLSSGNYTLEVEDPKKQFFFDQARVILSGVVLPPIEVIAKTQKEIERAKLEQALFGKQGT